MKRQTIIGLIAALTTGTVVLAAAAAEGDNRASFWPKLKGLPVVTEWYMDVPWHQKLGTFAGNQIDQALVLPYDALGQAEKDVCSNRTIPLSDEQCMIEIGVNSIIGIKRTDTPYDLADVRAKGGTYCGDAADPKDTKLPCIEVKLEISGWWTRGTGSKVRDRDIDLVQRPFGYEHPNVADYPSGLVITDGSTYAPQMPWYLSHYCDSLFTVAAGDAQDPVCYGDYLSPFNIGFAGNGPFNVPPNFGPWSVFPAAPAPPAVNNHCPGTPERKEGEPPPVPVTQCTMVMSGFDLAVVPEKLDNKDFQYGKYNRLLFTWFNNALARFPKDVTTAELERHYPWTGQKITWENFLYPQALFNPFLGTFADKFDAPANPSNCDVTETGPTVTPCYNTEKRKASKFLYPRQCTLDDLAKADLPSVVKLRQCSLNYEAHPNGFKAQWPEQYWPDFNAASMPGNQYGRTSFLFAGVPGMQLPTSFYKDPANDSGLSIHEQVYNASIFSMYLPVANVADFKNGMGGRNYSVTQFYHTLLMSNHNESDPQRFADGIRGKVLWHNEYRMEGMYRERNNRPLFRDRTFAAAFDPAYPVDSKDPKKTPAPFHNNTCDGCHVRNGSGIPINTEGKLDKLLQEFMTDGLYNYDKNGKEREQDYTFTGKIRPMKLVFFDLRRDTKGVDASRYSEPLSFPLAVVAKSARKSQREEFYYNNKIMNFYGDSFHVTTPGYDYVWNYAPIPKPKNPNDPNDPDVKDWRRLVVNDARINQEIKDPKTGDYKVYQPQKIMLGAFKTGPSCDLVHPAPTTNPWPANCIEVNGTAITAAIAAGDVGYMHLNGKRLGNLGAMEAIPNKAIVGVRDSQRTTLGNKIAGELIWQAGSRDGIDPKMGGKVQKCEDTKPKDLTQCFIGRFGWIGDRVSLEDQVANAAFVEMNMTTSGGYKQLYPKDDVKFPIRYGHPNCGPANKTCINSKGNADLTERDVERMADYARWLGNPTRSELKVALPEVIAGEKIFRETGCATCHVIKKIDIDPDDTMLTVDYRDRLKKRVQAATAKTPKVAPFLSYIGTDLLMHDMGYLSQVADSGVPVRDNNGVVLRKFENYVQKIRTPALKGLGLNRFVTDSFQNTRSYIKDPTSDLDAACDFLLHDGRACDAIEAAFLHDGPAIKKLGVIPKLNALTAEKVRQLRAFLYSL